MNSFSFQTIHTLEARSNMLLEVPQQHLKLTDPEVFQMIQGLLKSTVEILVGKGVVYEELRGVVVPIRDLHDRANRCHGVISASGGLVSAQIRARGLIDGTGH